MHYILDRNRRYFLRAFFERQEKPLRTRSRNSKLMKFYSDSRTCAPALHYRFMNNDASACLAIALRTGASE